ncbi:MAG TPA: hypothetical protein VFJ85_09840 [Acidimicrobiales bacterium]|nr:hypothetical protein [Acidimicrobiales bacterium]
MARVSAGPRLFTVTGWTTWVPKVYGVHHVELCVYLIRADTPEEAAARGWVRLRKKNGSPTTCHGWRVLIQSLGVDHVFDTGRDALDDFVDDPLVLSHLYPVVEGEWLDFYDPDRLVQPPTTAAHEKDYDDPFLPPSGLYLNEDEERWFGVKVWRTWTVGDEDRFVEEVILVVQAHGAEEARTRATDIALRNDVDEVNDNGETVHVRTVNVDYVFDTHSSTLVSRAADEVFGQLFELNPNGTVEWFDPDNDLPFREGALG